MRNEFTDYGHNSDLNVNALTQQMGANWLTFFVADMQTSVIDVRIQLLRLCKVWDLKNLTYRPVWAMEQAPLDRLSPS